MRLAQISAALVAALVGYGSTIALVLAAAAALGASPAQTISWVAAVSVAKGLGSALLSGWTRIPVVLAWSTPGAALIAATTGFDMGTAVGAFVLAGALIFVTGLVPALSRLISAIPTAIAGAMLAGVLLPFVMKVALNAAALPALILPLIGVFLITRRIAPVYATLVTLALGLVLAWAGDHAPLPAFSLSAQPFVFVAPRFDLAVLLGLGLPLYLVTMASQNLPGFAVLRSNGFEPPVSKALMVSGAGSAIAALFGAHTFNMAAITAAICLDEAAEPRRDHRWKVGLAYGAVWVAIGLLSPLILPALTIVRPEIIGTVAGLALIGPLMGAAAQAVDSPALRFPAIITLATTASGVAIFGIGAAFWGLCAGLLALGLDRIGARA